MAFPVSCPACGKSFSISDDVYDQKIKGRVVSVKCKQCQATIRVDGTTGTVGPKPGSSPTASPAAASPAAPPAEGSATPRAKAAAAAPAVTAAAAAPAVTAAAAPAVTAARPSPADAAPPTPRATPRATEPKPRAPEPAPPAPAAVAARPAAAPPAAAPLPAIAPATPPSVVRAEVAADEALLFAVDSPDGDRELTAHQIAAELARGAIHADTLVWRDGMAEWLEVKKVPELAKHLKPAPSRQAAPKPLLSDPAKGFRPRQPTLPMGAIPSPMTGKGFGAARESKPDTPLATALKASRGTLPTPAELKPGGAARANAVPTPGAGARAGSTPYASPARPTLATPSDPLDEEPTVLRSPEAMAALLNAPDEEHTPVPMPSVTATDEVLPNPPARPSSPFVSTVRDSPDAKRAWFPENEDAAVSPTAPLVAPPAPFAPVPSAPSALSPAALPAAPAPRTATPLTAPPTPFPARATFDDDVPFRAKRRTGLWVTLFLLLGAGGGAAYFFLFRRPPPPPPPVIPLQAAEPRARTSETSPDPTPAAAAAAPAPDTASADENAAPSDTAGETSGLPGRAKRSNSEFADLFAAGAKDAENETGTTARFDGRAAKSALDELLVEAGRCRERGGPTGVSRIDVTFAPSGTVSNAIVTDAPLAGTTTGNCIADVMKRATIRPFNGPPATVIQRISIR